MRKGHNSEVLTDNNQFVGICLGCDFVSEHEWGIKGIHRHFGFSKETTKRNAGLKCRSVTKFPENNMVFMEGSKSKRHYILFSEGFHYDFSNSDYRPKTHEELEKSHYGKELSYWKKEEEVSAAWSEGDFGISLHSSLKSQYEELKKAFEKKDICIFFGKKSKNNPFENNGLYIAIKSKLPSEFSESMKKSDIDAITLDKDAKATGIYKIVEESKYFALSPSRISAEKQKELKSKYDIMFWLNPQDQQENEYGWYTVEQLTRWGKNLTPNVISKVK